MKRKRFSEEQFIEILKLNSAGVKPADLCRQHGTGETTLYNWRSRYGGMESSDAKRLRALWQRQHPEFLQAVQEGRQKCLLFWEERALEMAAGSPGNSQMVILALKNRSRAAYGWHHDTQRMEHSGPGGAPMAIETTARNTFDVRRSPQMTETRCEVSSCAQGREKKVSRRSATAKTD